MKKMMNISTKTSIAEEAIVNHMDGQNKMIRLFRELDKTGLYQCSLQTTNLTGKDRIVVFDSNQRDLRKILKTGRKYKNWKDFAKSELKQMKSSELNLINDVIKTIMEFKESMKGTALEDRPFRLEH